jgi:hypothetical protein
VIERQLGGFGHGYPGFGRQILRRADRASRQSYQTFGGSGSMTRLC